MKDDKITEQDSHYEHLEKMSVKELLRNMNREDKTVAYSVSRALHQIEILSIHVIEHLQKQGRLFYLGAGTSGRLGIVDASECPPTFGVDSNLVIGLIAGGDGAIRKAVEFAEDDPDAGWADLQKHHVSQKDIVIGIAASGTTPYVVGALQHCNLNGIATGCITCNAASPLALEALYPVEVVVGPEFITGSTRMKAGTAQKMVLNMITTSAMIKLGRVKGNKMIDMQLSNNKLMERGTKMIMEELKISDYQRAKRLLLQYGSVRKAVSESKHSNGHSDNP